MIEFVISIIIFFFGAIIGSFLNVVILRYRSGRTLGGRSMCFSCGKQLAWTELVPIGSFLTQRGKCTGCRSPISWQYPLVEIATGALFVLLYQHFSFLLLSSPLLFAILFAYHAYIFCLLIVLSVYDLMHKILPDRLNALFGVSALIGMFFVLGNAIVLHMPTLPDLFAGIIIALPFALIWYFSKGKWMGLGDPKLMVGIGFLLGLSAGITAILFSFWIGAIVSILLLGASNLYHRGHVSMKTAIPFGPFLALGTMIVFLGNFDFSVIMKMFGN